MNKYAYAALTNAVKNLASNIAAKEPAALAAARDARIVSEWEKRVGSGANWGALGGAGLSGILLHQAANTPVVDGIMASGKLGTGLAALGAGTGFLAGTIGGSMTRAGIEGSRFMKTVKKIDPEAYARLKAKGY
jgi:hypothetical protein